MYVYVCACTRVYAIDMWLTYRLTSKKMDSASQIQIPDNWVYISLCVNTPENRIHPVILLPIMSTDQVYKGHYYKGWLTGLENSWMCRLCSVNCRVATGQVSLLTT